MSGARTPAVEPDNPFHALYARLSVAQDRLLERIGPLLRRGPRDEQVRCFGEFRGMLADVTTDAAKLGLKLREIRIKHPELWKLWQEAWNDDALQPAARNDG